jgi:hypothetical protein
MIILESGDSPSDIEKEIGFSILTNIFDDISYPDPDFVPSCEALEDDGGCYEMLFILGDGDKAVEIFIPKTSVDPSVLSMCPQLPIKILFSFGAIIKPKNRS